MTNRHWPIAYRPTALLAYDGKFGVAYTYICHWTQSDDNCQICTVCIVMHMQGSIVQSLSRSYSRRRITISTIQHQSAVNRAQKARTSAKPQRTLRIWNFGKTRMWANAQRDGCPAECRWRRLFNAAKFGWRPLLQCRAVTLPRRETCWNLQGAPNSPTDLSP